MEKPVARRTDHVTVPIAQIVFTDRSASPHTSFHGADPQDLNDLYLASCFRSIIRDLAGVVMLSSVYPGFGTRRAVCDVFSHDLCDLYTFRRDDLVFTMFVCVPAH